MDDRKHRRKFWIFIFTFFTAKAHGQMTPDPCTTYQSLNDTTLLTSYTSNIPICTPLGSQGWYRFIGNSDGVLSSVCPTGNQCGTDKQIWMNGTIPSTSDGIKPVTICVKEQTNCCRRQNILQVKNCTSFITFYLRTLPACNRLCFRDLNVTTSSSTTSTTTTTTTTKTTTTTITTTTAGHTSMTSPALKPTVASTSVSLLPSTYIQTSTTSAVPQTTPNLLHTTTQLTVPYGKTTVPRQNVISSATVGNLSNKQNCTKARPVVDRKSKNDACKRRNNLMTLFVILGAIVDCVLLVLVAYFGYRLYRGSRVGLIRSDTNSKTVFRPQNIV